MGLIQAAIGAIGGTLADQWKDFYTVPSGLAPTAALFAAVPQGQNAGRGSNTKGSDGVITNGSKILVPEGYGLVLMQDGAITGFAAEAGAYEWNSEAQDSQSIFAGNGIVSPLITTSWERFKFGGRPSTQQRAYFVTLKELPNNRFGTQSEIYWDDAYMNAQVGAVTRGTYTLKITDPILFIKNFVPAKYLEPGQVFDFTDLENDAASQLFNEVVGSLAPAFSLYTNDPAKGNRITKIQQDSLGFAQSLSPCLERGQFEDRDVCTPQEVPFGIEECARVIVRECKEHPLRFVMHHHNRTRVVAHLSCGGAEPPGHPCEHCQAHIPEGRERSRLLRPRPPQLLRQRVKHPISPVSAHVEEVGHNCRTTVLAAQPQELQQGCHARRHLLVERGRKCWVP